jgi:hypothetical protein
MELVFSNFKYKMIEEKEYLKYNKRRNEE